MVEVKKKNEADTIVMTKSYRGMGGIEMFAICLLRMSVCFHLLIMNIQCLCQNFFKCYFVLLKNS